MPEPYLHEREEDFQALNILEQSWNAAVLCPHMSVQILVYNCSSSIETARLTGAISLGINENVHA